MQVSVASITDGFKIILRCPFLELEERYKEQQMTKEAAPEKTVTVVEAVCKKEEGELTNEKEQKADEGKAQENGDCADDREDGEVDGKEDEQPEEEKPEEVKEEPREAPPEEKMETEEETRENKEQIEEEQLEPKEKEVEETKEEKTENEEEPPPPSKNILYINSETLTEILPVFQLKV